MRFLSCDIAGAFVLDIEPHEDERGLFARTFCAREFAEHDLATTFVQCSVSFSRRRGTVRGLHYQRPPSLEAKLVRCTTGAVHDVVVDLRRESLTFGRHVVVELSAATRRALYVPAMCAHGFQTLADDTEVFYQMTGFHDPPAAAGIRFDDPALGIAWPLPVTVISDRDSSLPLLSEAVR